MVERVCAKVEHRNFVKLYFDLTTDFYEYGWSRSFHFAARARGERFAASLTRHEHFLAHMLGLGPGMVALDLGCGIGGPLLEIARFTGAKVVGVNISSYQLERARRYSQEAGLDQFVEYVEGDFMDMDFPDGSFDAVYSIETTCCAPDKAGAFGEAYRVLRPGGRFGTYEYCLTDRFDAEDAEHFRIKADLELGGGLSEIVYPRGRRGAARGRIRADGGSRPGRGNRIECGLVRAPCQCRAAAGERAKLSEGTRRDPCAGQASGKAPSGA